MHSSTPSGVETGGPVVTGADSSAADQPVVHRLEVDSQHLRLLQVVLRDQTDVHNELVQVNEWLLHTAEVELSLPGNLFVVENTLTGSGTVLLKKAPLPHARPTPCPADLRVIVGEKRGFSFEVLGQRDGESDYEVVQLDYEGGRAGRTKVLHAYQQSQRPSTSVHQLPRFLSNTWGDRSRDSRIQHDFIEKEIEAGARLGVDVIQIDDGWQRGITANSSLALQRGGVWEGFWNADPQFWQANAERFPQGLAPLVKQAKAKGMSFGLWFAPDSWNHFANWEKDAACIVDLYRTLGVDHFKIDGVKAQSGEAFANLRRFFDTVLQETGGQVVFDLDVTAQVRPGYFGMMEIGPLFVENRYTDWHRYWPHQTLRNLWQLSQWVDPRRLRMEWLNHARNAQNYEGDPLAPGEYRPDFLFATVMFSNPLGWFEVSNLPGSYFEEAAPLVAAWREHREALFGGTILPVGDPPDGVGWSGFVSVADEGNRGYLLLFRGIGAADECRLSIPGSVAANYEVERLGGEGEAQLGDGLARVQGLGPKRYLFARFERAG